MNLFEAGVIPGVPTGAIVGALAFKSQGVFAAVCGSLGGLVAGAVLGWVYALAVICLMSVISVLWLAFRKQAHSPPSDSDHAIMSRTAGPGILAAVPVAGVLSIATSWLHVLVFLLLVAPLLALLAVARCQVKRHRRSWK